MENILNSFDSNLLNGNVQLASGINIPVKDYITYSVIPFLPNDCDNIKLKNGETIPLNIFIEKYVLSDCINNYNGNFKKYLEDVSIEDKIEENILIETINFENENKVDGMTKQTEEEIEKELESVEYSVSKDEKEPSIVALKSGEVSVLKKNDKGNLSFESKYLHTLKKSDNFELVLELQSLQFSLALFDIVLFSNKNKDVSKVQTESNKVVSDFESVKEKINNDTDMKYVKDYLEFISTIGTVGKFYSKPLLEKLGLKKEETIETVQVVREELNNETQNNNLLPKVQELLNEIEKQNKLWDVFKDNVRYTSFDSKDKEEMIERFKFLKNTINEYKVSGLISAEFSLELIDDIEEKLESLTDTQEFTGYGY